MNQDLKKVMDMLCKTCDNIDNHVPDIEERTGKSALKWLILDIVDFTMFLCAADGVLAWQEADYLHDLIGMDMTSDEITSYIKGKQLDSNDFLSTTPFSLTLFATLDDAIENASGKAPDTPAAVLLIKFLTMLGKDLISCDGDIDDSEKHKLNMYLNNLHDSLVRYRKEHNNDSTTFTGGKR